MKHQTIGGLTETYLNELKDRFWAKVIKGDPNECWEWTAVTVETGYGQIKINGKMSRAHRVSYELSNGPIPAGFAVCHICDKRNCVNPHHLFVARQEVNMLDMAHKGRSMQGVKNRHAKLTPSQVKEIKQKYQPGVTLKDLSNEYGVHLAQIHNIVSGKSWKHIQAG